MNRATTMMTTAKVSKMTSISAAPYGDEVDHVYARGGMGGNVPRGSRPAIVVVDLMNGFTDPDSAIGMDLSLAIRSTNALVKVARQISAPIVYITEWFSTAEVAARSVAWHRKLPNLRLLVEGSEATRLDSRLDVRPTDFVINKKTPSAFFGTNLAVTLTSLAVDTVLVCGATTSGCIRATVVDAVSSGFDVLVPADAVGDRAPGPHDSNLFDIQAKYGDVISQADAMSYLASLA